jgi:hypothetical protein
MNFRKNQNLMKFKFNCIKQPRFGKHFSQDFLEFTLVFTYFFYIFFSKFSKFEFKNDRFIISDQTNPVDFRRISENAANFFNPGHDMQKHSKCSIHI